MQSHIGRVHVCLAVTCHLRFWVKSPLLSHWACMCVVCICCMCVGVCIVFLNNTNNLWSVLFCSWTITIAMQSWWSKLFWVFQLVSQNCPGALHIAVPHCWNHWVPIGWICQAGVTWPGQAYLVGQYCGHSSCCAQLPILCLLHTAWFKQVRLWNIMSQVRLGISPIKTC